MGTRYAAFDEKEMFEVELTKIRLHDDANSLQFS